MNQFNKDLMAALAQKQDLNETFHQYLEQAINELLQHELATFLVYEPYDLQGFNSCNLRNGSYQRTFKTQYASLNLTIPRCLLHTPQTISNFTKVINKQVQDFKQLSSSTVCSCLSGCDLM